MKKIISVFVLLSFMSSTFAQSAAALRAAVQANSKTAKSSSDDDANFPDMQKLTQFSADPQLAMSAPNYQVTAGDVYTLAFAVGTTPINYTIPVDTTYRIRIANLGVLNCKGLTFNELKNQVDSLVSKNYPMGGVQFVLTAPAVFLVSITGEVLEATEQKAWALTRLSSFISSSLTDYSSIRNISIISETGEKKDFDLYKAKRDGDFAQDPYLRPGDKIVINRFDRKVTITGMVERPGVYEILPGENLKDLVDSYGGGLQNIADINRIELYRLDGQQNAGVVSYLTQKDIDANYELKSYDTVTVSSYKDIQNVVFFQGAVDVGTVADADQTTVKRPITFFGGKNYATLIRDNKNLFSSSSDLEHSYIIRLVNGEETHIPIDLSKILYDAEFMSTERAQNGDILLVPFKLFFVTVSGAVANPGRFPYIPDRDWRYYVGLAGGIDTSRNSKEKMDILANDGTVLSANGFIPAEATIDVKENSLWYKWNKVAPTVTTLLTIVSTALSIIVVSQSLK